MESNWIANRNLTVSPHFLSFFSPDQTTGRWTRSAIRRRSITFYRSLAFEHACSCWQILCELTPMFCLRRFHFSTSFLWSKRKEGQTKRRCRRRSLDRCEATPQVIPGVRWQLLAVTYDKFEEPLTNGVSRKSLRVPQYCDGMEWPRLTAKHGLLYHYSLYHYTSSSRR